MRQPITWLCRTAAQSVKWTRYQRFSHSPPRSSNNDIYASSLITQVLRHFLQKMFGFFEVEMCANVYFCKNKAILATISYPTTEIVNKSTDESSGLHVSPPLIKITSVRAAFQCLNTIFTLERTQSCFPKMAPEAVLSGIFFSLHPSLTPSKIFPPAFISQLCLSTQFLLPISQMACSG